MKSNLYILIGLAAIISFTNGCAFSRSVVKLDFKPQITAEKISLDKIIVVERLKDVRGGDPYLIANKGVSMKTSGTYVAEEAVAVVVTDAIKDTLSQLNCKLAVEQGDLALSGELLRLDSAPIMGFWSGQLDCSIQVNLKLSDARTGGLIWTELLTGFNKKSGLQVDHEGHRKDTMEAALADLTNKLATSASFRRALETLR